MGSCCTKSKHPRLVNRHAYKTELGASFFDSIPNCPPDALVVIIHFKGLTDICDSADITSFSGPYLQLKLFPSDPIAGDQIQRSSFKPGSINPLWVPQERFQIVSTAKDKAKIMLSIYNFLPSRDPEPIGDVNLPLKGLSIGDKKAMSMQLIDPNGKKLRAMIQFDFSVVSVNHAKSTEQQSAYQFQRYVVDWGKHFLPGEHEWSSVDGRKQSNVIEDIAPLPEGWTPTVNWYNISTEEDPDGWQYASDMHALSWFNTPDALRCVRRRMMVREISAPYRDNENSGGSTTMNTPLLGSNTSIGGINSVGEGGGPQLATTRGVTPGSVARQSRRKSVL